MKLYIAFFLFLLFFIGINIAFLDNLRKLWNISYPIVLLVINLDLLVLFLVFILFFRKFIKTYISGKKGPLRKKLSISLMLYIITPLIFLNLATSIILLQSTKSFISGQLKELATSSEKLGFLIQDRERRYMEVYREMFSFLKEKGKLEDFSTLSGVKGVYRDPECREDIKEDTMILCVDNYKIVIAREGKVEGLAENIKSTTMELRNMVRARDIIGGIYVYFLVLAGFVSFLSAVWFGNLIARYISLPLEKLSQKAKEIAKGNFDVNLEIPQTRDEIQELAQTFYIMKEELKRIYSRLREEKETLLRLFNALPVGIVFISKDGEKFQNAIYEELSKKTNVRESSIELDIGRVIIYEDLEAVILAERFKTWQMAVKRIAHEIKNPLTPISLNLERLIRAFEKGDFNKEKVIQLTSLILSELERIRRTIDQFRSLSMEVEPEFKELNLTDLIRQVARIYEDLMIEVNGSIKVVGDERLLRDMFFNLFNNSLEWGAKRVWLEIEENRMVYKDDGVGIEEGKEEVIFLPYHSENPKGMGLGLAIVKHIAELHGWKVKALPKKEGFYMVFEFKSNKGNI